MRHGTVHACVAGRTLDYKHTVMVHCTNQALQAKIVCTKLHAQEQTM